MSQCREGQLRAKGVQRTMVSRFRTWKRVQGYHAAGQRGEGYRRIKCVRETRPEITGDRRKCGGIVPENVPEGRGTQELFGKRN